MTLFTITNCIICKGELELNFRGKKYCSDACRQVAWNNKYRDKYRKKNNVNPGWMDVERCCVLCQTTFKPKSINQKYCSGKCRDSVYTFDYIHNNTEKVLGLSKNKWLKARMVILDRDGFTCKYCGRSPMKDAGVVLHIDHKVPRKHGGGDDLDNLITSCEQCNLGKTDLLLSYWLNEKNGN